MASGHKPCLTEIKRGLGAAQRQIMLSSFLVINEQAPLGRSKKPGFYGNPPHVFPISLIFLSPKWEMGQTLKFLLSTFLVQIVETWNVE